MKTCESSDSTEPGNAEVEHHDRYHSALSSPAVPVLFVLKKPKPNPDGYEGSLSLSVSTKSYELSRGKRKFTEKNEFAKKNACNFGALCWHLQSRFF